ncbi:hypothetical protein [Brevundimonas subvibrioides]|uniref:Uncharacterized protein n=1 Tax=Brevundimonas subvibrioides (strain ATCC 15264 / DSM 4735 / LMG 14903 / NBRC 16000 / CB 81) TaxID=633149 RepID=D9QJ15_BRESC|nr:hypothetical protein [Brevundimonas subvibrioides]ADK99539.1 hypothetical protein Bresu_0225 [Brevundimonas subvibrioides ATCC 15264]
MDSLFAQLGNLLQGLLALADSGFDGVNQVLGLVIAGVFAFFLMGAWSGLGSAAFGAMVVHTLIEAVRPMLDGGAFALPDLTDMSFWMTRLALFLGYAIVIAVFFFVRTLLTGGFGRRRSHAH